MKTYLSNLTPLRGIAALLTVIFHVDLMLGNGGGMLLRFNDTRLISRMYLMVDFFFILSGFVMCHVYGQWFSDRVQMVDFKRFTIARFARVYPLHLAMLCAVLLIFSVSGWMGIPQNPIIQTENSLFSFVTNLLLLQSMNLHHWFSWDHAAWSISTEWWMYMLFPFLVRPFMKLRSVGRVAVVIGCFLGYAGITVYILPFVTYPASLPFFKYDPTDNSINVAYQYGFLRCLFGFVLGMMMYLGYRENWGKAWLANGYTLIGLTLGLGSCMHLAIPDVFTVSFLPLLLLSAAYGSQRTNALFGAKPLQRLGDWSFSIYLVHQPLLFVIGSIMAYQTLGQPAVPGPPTKPDMLTGWLMCLAFIGLTLLVASLTYRFVEVPARQLLNGRFHKPAVESEHSVLTTN
ncbi:acyltransferase family protein [uncultured Fibrella sp.]|uniref:acyltransferase family protein n=1 Tax=uncultured Fibrella sp. TaxID=1284596 RepID=UPI0035CBB682